jgi:hypothetical protein
MGSLIEELEAREVAARAEADGLRARIEELSGELALAEERVSRLVITREEVMRVLEEPPAADTAGRDGGPGGTPGWPSDIAVLMNQACIFPRGPAVGTVHRHEPQPTIGTSCRLLGVACACREASIKDARDTPLCEYLITDARIQGVRAPTVRASRTCGLPRQ